MKGSIYLLLLLAFSFQVKGQSTDCKFDKPAITITFGSGNSDELETEVSLRYDRVEHYCPSDGHYTFTPYTSDCFRGDWHTLREDHTPGDASGNMMLVNSSYDTGEFFRTTVRGLKAGKIYEFAAWMMNVCKISEKCPYPLLPNITITLQTIAGKMVTRFRTGDVDRQHEPNWTQYRAYFTTPATETTLVLIMTNNHPGGCGNDFALDDITFRECIKTKLPIASTPKTKPETKKPTPPATKPVAKKTTSVTDKKKQVVAPVANTNQGSQVSSPQSVKPKLLSAAPLVLRTRENNLVKKIETGTGEINIKLYDNGQIDEDTVSIYHNNVLLISRARLSEKAISLNIAIDPSSPHHELVMVAENLGSIPPNTSLMIVTAGTKRYEVFISSSEQKNAKVVFDLKE